MKKFVLIILGSVISMALYGCLNSDSKIAAGGGQTTNGISGKVQNQQGLVAGAIVYIYPIDYNPLSTESPVILIDTTNEEGIFYLENIIYEQINIQVTHPNNNTKAIIQSIDIPVDNNMDTINAVLTEPSTLTINIQEMNLIAGDYLYLEGTDVFVEIDSIILKNQSIQMINIPPGRYSQINVSQRDFNSLITIPDDKQSLNPGETKEMGPYDTWDYKYKLSINTSFSGADVSETMINFPLLIRLDESNIDFSKISSIGFDLLFTKSDKQTILDYEIERWDKQIQKAEIWVKVDTVLGNNENELLYMYIRNQLDTSALIEKVVFDSVDGFQGAWHFSETKKEPVLDASEFADNGTMFGILPGPVEGIIGISQSFNGDSDYISTIHDISFGLGDEITLSVWVKIDTSSSLGGFISDRQDHGNYTNYQLFSSGENQISFRYQDADSNLFHDYQTDPTFVNIDKGWVFAAFTYVYGDSTTARIYINGSIVPGLWRRGNGNRPPRQSSFPTRFGREHGRFFKGQLDEPRISKVSRNKGWIKLCYETQKEGSNVVTINPL